MHRTLALAGAAVLLGSAAPALSGEPARGPAVRVAYGDLDLNSQDGAAAMLRRISLAAAQACRQTWWAVGSDIEAIERFDRCHSDAIRQAVVRLGRPAIARAAGLGVHEADAATLVRDEQAAGAARK